MSLLVSLFVCMNTENRLLGNTEELSEYLILNIASMHWSKPFSEGWYKKLNAEHWTQVVFKDYVLILNTDCQSISARDDTELSLSGSSKQRLSDVQMRVHSTAIDIGSFEIDTFNCCFQMKISSGHPDLRALPIRSGELDKIVISCNWLSRLLRIQNLQISWSPYWGANKVGLSCIGMWSTTSGNRFTWIAEKDSHTR